MVLLSVGLGAFRPRGARTPAKVPEIGPLTQLRRLFYPKHANSRASTRHLPRRRARSASHFRVVNGFLRPKRPKRLQTPGWLLCDAPKRPENSFTTQKCEGEIAAPPARSRAGRQMRPSDTLGGIPRQPRGSPPHQPRGDTWQSSSTRCSRPARASATRSSLTTSRSASSPAPRSASWVPTAWASRPCSRSWPARRRSPTVRRASRPATRWASSSRSRPSTTTRPSSRTCARPSATCSPRWLASTTSPTRWPTPTPTSTPSWPRWASSRTRSTPWTAGTSTPSSRRLWTPCSARTPTRP